MLKRPGVLGDQLDDNIIRGTIFAEDLDLGEQLGLDVAVDELRGLLDCGEHVLVGAEELPEEEVVWAEAVSEAVAENAVRVDEDDAADVRVGEADVPAEEVDLGRERDVGPVVEQVGGAGHDTGEVGAREAEAAEEGEDGVRLLGGTQVDARGLLGGGGLREAAGIAEEVDREGARVCRGVGGGGTAAQEVFEEMPPRRGRAARGQGFGGADATEEEAKAAKHLEVGPGRGICRGAAAEVPAAVVVGLLAPAAAQFGFFPPTKKKKKDRKETDNDSKKKKEDRKLN